MTGTLLSQDGKQAISQHYLIILLQFAVFVFIIILTEVNENEYRNWHQNPQVQRG